MDRNELRQACQTAAAAIVAESYVPQHGDVVDAVIRTVIDEVAGMLLGYAKQERDASDLDGYQAFRNAALLVRHLLPSTDSEAVRDGIR